MNTTHLNRIARALMADDKGILAMDESTATCNRLFAAQGIRQTAEMRRAYRDMLVTTPCLGECISGAILSDETIRQQTFSGASFATVLKEMDIIPGIKVDLGAKPLAAHPGEKITEGLDGLRERLAKYCDMGASFAKWRAVIVIDGKLPSQSCIESNAHALARYAALCQEAGLVPIVEPEVLMDGEHDLAHCLEVTQKTLRMVFTQLRAQRVVLEGMILKPNMILPGLSCSSQMSVDEIAEATVDCLLETVPAAVPGIAFLSGGQSSELATARLDIMNARYSSQVPWALSFSFGRALQEPALSSWLGDVKNVPVAQNALMHQARCNRAARRGYHAAGIPLHAL